MGKKGDSTMWRTNLKHSTPTHTEMNKKRESGGTVMIFINYVAAKDLPHYCSEPA